MKKENKIERILKYPLRAIEKDWSKKMNEYKSPKSTEEVRNAYMESKVMNPLMLVGIPILATSLALYGIAEGGRYCYNKIVN